MKPDLDALRDLFEQALARPPEARGAFLDQACADPALRAELDALLASHETAPTYLDDLAQRILGPAFATSAEDNHRESLVGQEVGRYRIVRELGRGGMGVVYLAEDPRLDRRVALKLLPPYLSADDGAKRRLVSEAKAAAALDHPHVATVHEIDETEDGRLFIAMAYVEGETLRERLKAGPLPVEEALAIARQIAQGLGAAHRRGIVHRDVKPSNVLLTPGGGSNGDPSVKLVDFGIAKAVGAELTRQGVILGTVAYMSPEQTRGQDVDARTDLWSLGVVLYEMLAGQRPFQGASDATLIHAIRHDVPEPVGRLRAATPEALAGIVTCCLKKVPDDRYPDAEAVLAALHAMGEGKAVPRRRRMQPARWARLGGVGALLVVVLIAAGLFLWPGMQEGTGRLNPGTDALAVEARRVAVLPLASYSADLNDAYFADGMTEELIARLSKLSDLRVIARSSSMSYKDTEKSIAEIGRELGVRTILEGSVRKADDQVRIAVQLVDAQSQEPFWAEDYDAEAGDVLGVQQRIAEQVAEALDVQLQAGERLRLGKRGTDVPEAYEHYLKGRYLLHKWEPTPLEEARDHFQRALDLDPTFAGAWAGLADVHVVFGYLAVLTPQEVYARGRAAAERALALDDELAEAHNALASVLADDPREWEAAEHHFRRALSLDPSYAFAHQYYAELLRDQGRFEEAFAEIEQAQALDPLSPYAQLVEGIILWFAGRHDDALAAFRNLLSVYGTYPPAHLFMGLVYLDMGQYEQAIEEAEIADPDQTFPDVLSVRGVAWAGLGRRDSAQAVLDDLDVLSEQRYVSSYLLAQIYDALGEQERAFLLLDQAVEERSWFVRILKAAPGLDSIRSDPRYQALLDKAGFAE